MKEISPGLWIDEKVRSGRILGSVEGKIFHIKYRDDQYFHKDIKATLLFVSLDNVINADAAWIYAIKDISDREYCRNKETYADVIINVQTVLKSYFKDMYGYIFPRIVLIDHESSIFVN